MAKTPKAKAEKAATPEAPKYGVTDLAELINTVPAMARVRLRKSKFEKNGSKWGWNTKAELEEVAKELLKTAEKPAAEPKAKKTRKVKADA